MAGCDGKKEMAGNKSDCEKEREGNWVWCDDKKEIAGDINHIFIEWKFS